MSTAGYSCWICPLCYRETRDMTDQCPSACHCGYRFIDRSRLAYIVEDAGRSAGSVYDPEGDMPVYWQNPAFKKTQREELQDLDNNEDQGYD